MPTLTPRCVTILLVVALLALALGHIWGYERAVQQVEECANARTPLDAQLACPRWMR